MLRQLKYVKSFSNYKNYGNLFDTKLDTEALIQDKQQHMIDYFRRYGHMVSKLDPLGLVQRSEFPSVLDFGIKYNEQAQTHGSIEQLEEQLKKFYTSTVGVQFDHIEDPEEKAWLYSEYEKLMQGVLQANERTNIQNILIQQEAIDHYMHKKFTTFKRYAGEGGEGTAIALRVIYAYASELGVTNIVQSMAHRGRFPLMCSLLDFQPSDIFRKIMGESDLPNEYTQQVDDVVHHLSTSIKRRFPGAGCKEQDITISVVHNPSHLEAANPVSQGKTKAKQDDSSIDQILNVQLHGDAAFAGQGIVYESLLLSGLNNYSNGGTVHIIQNNQIGYTTDLKDARSTRYSSDVMIGFNYPVIHINGEDVETIHKVSKLAVSYRQRYRKDFLIDLITYRRYGHNEVDEPSFTQPTMYNVIRNKQTLPQAYHSQLVNEGLSKKEDYDKIVTKVNKHLDQEYEVAKTITQDMARVKNENHKGSKAFTGKWSGMEFSQFCPRDAVTGIDASRAADLGLQSVTVPQSFNLHNRLQKFFIEDRKKQIEDNSIDWATAEAISISSLLEDGYNVRLSGQDVERGTFSQRHWVFTDQKTEAKWAPIQEFAESKSQGRLQVVNSPLSEAAVQAYDFGYSMESPKNLVIWEAQFGDFFNTGQSIIDTFITCSEEKWMRQSSLVMLLPHGYDGAGPEHSSSRMERFLQNGVQNNNFQFVVPSTPANVFHMYRRQMLRKYRKPLIVASAKSLLRDKKARSLLSQIGSGTEFSEVISYNIANAKKIIITYGKMTYEVQELLGDAKYGLISLEQLLPFPTQKIKAQLSQADPSADIYFVQEEPENAGAFQYSSRYIKQAIKESGLQRTDIQYIGRPESASVAVGATKLHKKQLEELHKRILSII